MKKPNIDLKYIISELEKLKEYGDELENERWKIAFKELGNEYKADNEKKVLEALNIKIKCEDAIDTLKKLL